MMYSTSCCFPFHHAVRLGFAGGLFGLRAEGSLPLLRVIYCKLGGGFIILKVKGRGFSLAEESNKPCALIGGRDAACLGFAHQLIPIACNDIVDGITKRAWNENEEVEQWPETR